MFRTYKRNGIKFYLTRGNRKADKWIIDTIFNRFNYNAKRELAIDIGAHIGALSLLLATKYKATVYAIEPNQDNFVLLKKNIRVNSLGRLVTPLNIAVSDRIGIETLYGKGGLNSGQYSLVYNDEFLPIGRVFSVTLDAFVSNILERTKENKIDYLKMDIEGAEFKVLTQCPSILKKIHLLDIDMHDPYNFDYFEFDTVETTVSDLVDLIKMQGFEIERHIPTSSQYKDGNYLFRNVNITEEKKK